MCMGEGGGQRIIERGRGGSAGERQNVFVNAHKCLAIFNMAIVRTTL